MFDRQRVRPSGLACELVVAAENAGIPEETLKGQFAAPLCGQLRLRPIRLHPGHPPRRLRPRAAGPCRRTARDRWVAGPLGQTGRCLGHQPHRTWRLHHRPDRRSPLPGRYRNPGGGHPPHHFEDPDPAAPPEGRHFYDQIARFADGPGVPALSLRYVNAGMFNFAGGLVPATNAIQLSWWISDHFPLWVEFRLRL